jgi:hypothetical protein
VNQDNTVVLDNPVLQIEKVRWRNTLAGGSVIVHEHCLDWRWAGSAITEDRSCHFQLFSESV